jgi:hypothetical protein
MVNSYFMLGLLALSAVAFVGCDSNEDEDEVFGMWRATEFPFDEETDEETTAYFDISADEIDLYVFIEAPEVPDFEPCYFTQSAEVISRDGDEWVIESDGERTTSTFRVDGDELIVTDSGDTVRFERDNVNPSSLTPLCPDGDFRSQQRFVR